MKIKIDDAVKAVLMHWVEQGCIDTEELKAVEDGHLLGGTDYDFADFTDEELKEFYRLKAKATTKRNEPV